MVSLNEIGRKKKSWQIYVILKNLHCLIYILDNCFHHYFGWRQMVTPLESVSIVNAAQVWIQNTDTMPHCADFDCNLQTNNPKYRSNTCLHCLTSDKKERKGCKNMASERA